MKDRAPRKGMEVPLEIEFEDSEDVFVGLSVNISETGMLFKTDEPRPKGAMIRFEFRPRFSGVGEVVWSEEAEDGGTVLGIKFRSLSRGGQDILVRLLDDPDS